MLWQGEEFGENYFLPGYVAGRVGLLRPLRWDYFYDEAGRSLVTLVRKLLRVRRQRPQLRRGSYFSFNHWDHYLSRGVLLFARYLDAQYTLVAVNTSNSDQIVPFWFPVGGNYVEDLHGDSLNLHDIMPLQETTLAIPSNYGRIWTTPVATSLSCSNSLNSHYLTESDSSFHTCYCHFKHINPKGEMYATSTFLIPILINCDL